MKIRRFVAPSMREALAQVREELGAEAVIISSGRSAEGLEVFAAADYDAALAASAPPGTDRGRAQPQGRGPDGAAGQPATAPGFDSVLARVGGGRAAAPPQELDDETLGLEAGAPDGPRLAWSQGAEIVAMRREVEALRRLLEYQLSRLAWDDLARREPFRAKVLRDLSSLDIAPDLARDLVNAMPSVTNPEDAGRVAMALLVRRIPVVDDGLLASGGVFALVGPTGIGKTTTIAKLAAHYVQRRGPDAVGLISIDSYRIGAREHLGAYARMLGVPMKAANSPAELARALEEWSRRSLVLVDTAGVGQQDLRLREQAALIRSRGGAIKPLLVLPANADVASLDDIVRAHAPLAPAACVVTKIDEAASLGPVLSATMRASLPIAHLCDGQRVPEDLHAAAPRKVWLVRRAVKLRARTGRVADDHYLAEHFGGARAHG
ncbi:MAG: flagellar biosynthesis protein FlhF [Steroidobacteraceae bacterium]|jgi:flagellar biosynthesis protein FlhF|nr:flagellar biosynthesis protein FlhF [Steroidobacteraceae bacterium]